MKNFTIKISLIVILFFINCNKESSFYPIKNKPATCDFLSGQYNDIKRMSKDEQIIALRRGGNIPQNKKDTDKDGFTDNIDNCITTFNPDQKDTDNDGIGDACDTIPTPNDTSQYQYTLFLDFDGHTLTSIYWTNTPLNLLPSGLSNTEIQNIVNEVKKDYDTWKINITTDSTIFLKTSPDKRQRIVITQTSEWYGNAGGVAYVGSMFWGLNVEAFVFSKLLGYNQKNIWEATSHEGGHTIGLYHQSEWNYTNCTFLNEYRNGTIMGVGYYSEPIYWTVGPTATRDVASKLCGKIQNDTLIISSQLPKRF